MREWLVIEDSRQHSIFAPDTKTKGYIPRDVAEPLLGRALTGTVWFTKEESERMRKHPDWRDDEPGFTPLGFWS